MNYIKTIFLLLIGYICGYSVSKFKDSRFVAVIDPKTSDEPFEEIDEACSCDNKTGCCNSEEVSLSSSPEHAEIISRKI